MPQRKDKKLNLETLGVSLVGAVSKLINGLVCFLVLVFFLLSLYSIFDVRTVQVDASAGQYSAYKATAENMEAFADLKKKNPELVGWIQVFDTGIDYPFFRAADNDKYINQDAYCNFSLSGSIFLDYRNAPDFTDFSSILYGHHMAGGVMFGDIGKYAEEAFYQNHRRASLHTENQVFDLEIIAYIQTDAFDPILYKTDIKDRQARREYLDHVYDLAMYSTPLELSDEALDEEHLLTLYTCMTSTYDRQLLIGRLTNPQALPPPGSSPAGGAPARDKAPGRGLSLELILGAVSLLLLLLSLLASYFAKKYLRERRAQAAM